MATLQRYRNIRSTLMADWTTMATVQRVERIRRNVAGRNPKFPACQNRISQMRRLNTKLNQCGADAASSARQTSGRSLTQ